MCLMRGLLLPGQQLLVNLLCNRNRAKFISIGQPIGIINADSMQVYSDLPVLTARPRESDVNHIPHYLYGIINAHQKGSVKWWL